MMISSFINHVVSTWKVWDIVKIHRQFRTKGKAHDGISASYSSRGEVLRSVSSGNGFDSKPEEIVKKPWDNQKYKAK